MLLMRLLYVFFAAGLSLSAQDSSTSGQETVGTSSAASAYPYHQAYQVVPDLNTGLAPAAEVYRDTPRGVAAFFLDACERGDFQLAAHALNLNALAAGRQSEEGATRAEQLHYVINQRVWLDWGDLPDRPDGVPRSAELSSNGSTTPRRSIRLAGLELEGRPVSLRLERLLPDGQQPVWVFSKQTVHLIPDLYDAFGPGLLDRHLPAWAKMRLLGNLPIWHIVVIIGLFGVSVAFALGVLRLVQAGLRHASGAWTNGLAKEIPLPAVVLAAALFFHSSVTVLISLTGIVSQVFHPLMTIVLVASMTWLGIRVIGYLSNFFSAKHTGVLQDTNYDPHSRRMLTYITIARRVFAAVVLAIGIGVVLSQFHIFQALGISLLASAGVMSVIVGVAAHSVLGNLLAGVQIGVTEPITIGDNVYFEGQWGYIESITYTYVTIRTWDRRRIIVPLKYLVTHPIENWTMEDTHLVKPIHVYADYRIDIDEVREAYAQMLREADEWDEREDPVLQVTDATEETIELRALCSAADPGAAWNLHCKLREKLVRYIQQLEEGKYLPRRRLEISNGADADHAATTGGEAEPSSPGETSQESRGNGPAEGGAESEG